MLTSRPWDRLLWGVVLTARTGPPFLLGDSWDRSEPTGLRDSEPTRALLFQTRKQAREWARDKRAAWQGTGAAHWKLRVVRVRETVREVTDD